MGRDFKQERRSLRDRMAGGYTLDDVTHRRRVDEQRAKLQEQQKDQAKKAEALGVPLFGEVR